MSIAGDGDKRTVSTDALATIGSLIDEREKRDAIHLAVEPTVAKERLRPGDSVTVDGYAAEPGMGVGIVDPFLLQPVRAGERFWLVVYPREIHSLRHVWTHPAFPNPAEVQFEVVGLPKPGKAASEAWLRDFVSRADIPVGFDELMRVAQDESDEDFYIDNDHISFRGSSASGEIPPEFWTHVENYTGRPCPYKPTYFSCSC